MIIVSTAQDAVAMTLNAYAPALVASLPPAMNSVTLIGPPLSTASRVQRELQTSAKASLLFFGHGLNPPALGFLAHDGNPALDGKTISLLSGRVVCATCCHGNTVGALARRHAFSLLGYAGQFWVALHPQHITDMEGAALAGPRAIMAGSAPVQAAPAVAREYARLALTLHRRNISGDRAFALFVSMNSSIVAAW